MTRPSRGERRSATTTRHTGSFFPPTRVSLMLTATWIKPSDRKFRPRSLALPHELAEVRHLALLDPAHQLAHLVELLDELVDLLDGHARALGDAQPARALDQLRPAPLLRRHRENDRLDAIHLLLVDVHLRELVTREPRDHPEQRR